MAIPRNKQSILSAFSGFDTTLRVLFVDRPKAYVLGIREKLKNLPKTNFDLGCDFADQGKWKDALFRFRVAIYLQPNFTQAHYNLGCCQLRLGQRAAARQSFLTTLKLQPNHTDALFMLSAVDPNAIPADKRPQRMPVNLVQPFFTAVAPQYDAIELNNSYQGGRVVFDALKPLLEKTRDLVIVDLGAGTGIASRPWRPMAKEIVGVEFNPSMANAARLTKIAETPLFDRVLEEDIAEGVTTAAIGEADVILLVNTAQFLGNLQPLFTTLGATMKKGALLAVTIEPFSAPAGFGVNVDTGRFGHHPEYVKLTGKTAGLELKQDSKVQLYPAFNAQLFIFGK